MLDHSVNSKRLNYFFELIILIVLFLVIGLTGCAAPKITQGILKRPIPHDGSRQVLDCNQNGWLFDSQEVHHRPFSLSPPTYYEAGGDLGRLAVADFNHDGALDIAVTNPIHHSISILFNDGAGGYSDDPAVELSMADGSMFVAAGDFNGDDYIDLIASRSSNEVVLFLNDTSVPGIFTATTHSIAPPAAGTWSIHGLASADMNNDGISEVLVTSSHSSTENLTVLRNGGGVLDLADHFDLDFAVSPTALAVADMDMDGDIDIAVATTGVIRIFTNNGTDEFSTERYEMTGRTVTHLAFGDLNRDSLPELVGISKEGGSNYAISILVNQSHDGTIAFDEVTYLTFPEHALNALQVDDVDNDGYRDLLVTGDSALHILLNKGDNTFERARRIEVANATYLASTALNRMNPDDIVVVSNNAHPRVAVLFNESRIARDCNLNRSPDECDLTSSARISSDCNSNKVPDECDLQANINLSPREFSFFRSPFFYDPVLVAIGFRGPDPDLLVINGWTGDYTRFLINDGTGTFTAFHNPAEADAFHLPERRSYENQLHYNGISFFNEQSVAMTVGEFTGDARDDIASAGIGGTDHGFPVKIIHGRTAGSGSLLHWEAMPTAIYISDSPLLFIESADLDGDGDQDLVVARSWRREDPTHAPSIVLLRNNGDHNFTAETREIELVGEPTSLTIGDLDNDDLPEIVYTQFGSNNVFVQRNYSSADGFDFARVAVRFPAGSIPVSVKSGDLNADGYRDLVVANDYSNTLAVLMNTEHSSWWARWSRTFITPLMLTLDPVETAIPKSLEIIDIDLDGNMDLVSANWGSDSVSVIQNKGDTTFADAIVFSAGYRPEHLIVHNFDNDTRPDVAVANADGKVHILVNRSMPPFSEDTDRDGRPDGCAP